MNYLDTFKKKKIIITGHTGFKGSWLTLCLKYLGAEVLGISKDIPTKPSHFTASRVYKGIKSRKFNIKNFKKLKKTISQFKPDYVFHLAAQSLVNTSYKNPQDTWETNLLGTINVLESIRYLNKKVVVVIITSDKAYKNVEKKEGYKETDLLGGDDPYSASKASAEIAIQSYFNSYLKNKKNVFLGVARAGNVIGGGDWSKDRLIPDCIRAWAKKRKAIIRNPKSTRPWQHVLEAVWGYIFFAAKLNSSNRLNGQAFNFGPNTKKNFKVIELIKMMQKHWPSIKYSTPHKKTKKFHESSLLKLNCNKAKTFLKWRAVLNFEETITMTAQWYKNFYKNKIHTTSIEQIEKYNKIFIRRIK
tara:strand:- start:1169 stop:2245 length:1077 start_codon:yes stop_codon:yes gene_type:complete